MVGLDTGGDHLGIGRPPAPTAGGFIYEMPFLWAVARRKQLSRLSAKSLAIECYNLLAKHAEAARRREAVVEMSRSMESQKKRDLVNLRYDYAPSLIEAARTLRAQGLSCGEARNILAKQPHECSTGATVSIERDRVAVIFGGKVRVHISEQQFIKNWWPKGRIPPTA
jgi:hypothetical protein